MSTNETYLAREHELEVNTGTTAAPDWTVVRGWTSLSPSSETERTDDTHAHSGGWAQHKVSQRGVSFSIDLQVLRNAEGVMDPGQQALRDLGELVGGESLGEFRYYHKPSGEGFQFPASVDIAWPGGGTNDNATASGTLQVDGKPTPVTVTPTA